MFYYLIVAALLVLLWLRGLLGQLVNYCKLCQKFRKIPGPCPMGLIYYVIGNFDMVYYCIGHLSPLKAMFQIYTTFGIFENKRFSGLMKFHMGWTPGIILYSASAVEPLLNCNVNINKFFMYHFLDKWLGNGLLTSSNNEWRKHRKILTPSFHFRILDTFVPVMNECTKEMLEKIEQESDTGVVDIRSFITNCALDTICETAMGVRIGAQTGSPVYVNPLNRIMELLLERMINPFYFNKFIYSLSRSSQEYNSNLHKVHSFVNKVIQEQKEKMRQMIQNKSLDLDLKEIDAVKLIGFKKRFAFMDLLLVEHFRNPDNFTMKEIQDEVNTFMFEGHDTTTSGLIFTLLLIGENQRVQDKIFDELESIYGNDMSRPITIDDCRQMKYLEMTLKESFRIYPPVPSFGRTIDQDCQIQGHTIPAGSECSVNVYALHRDPSVFPHPERFIPERFEPDAAIHRMPYAYLPFSAGPRNCIGQKFAILETKITIISVLRQFRLRSITQRDQVELEASLVLKSHSPVLIQFERRC